MQGPVDTDAAPRSFDRRRVLLLAVVLVAAFAVGAAGVGLLLGDDRSTDLPGDVEQGRLGAISGGEATALPDAELEGFGGDQPVAISAYRGEPLVVNFWATWCAPCVAEMPDFQEVAEDVDGQVAFLGVNYRDPDREATRAFVAELGITYDLAVDPAGEYFAEVGGVGMPTTLFVDRRGVVVYRHTGALSAEQLRDLLTEHLAVEVARP